MLISQNDVIVLIIIITIIIVDISITTLNDLFLVVQVKTRKTTVVSTVMKRKQTLIFSHFLQAKTQMPAVVSPKEERDTLVDEK